MNRLALLGAVALGLLVSSCDPSPAKMSEKDMAFMQEVLPGMSQACVRNVRAGGIEAFPTSTEDCFEMNQPRKWRGLWSNEFEGSRFCGMPARSCAYDTPGDWVWLSWPTHSEKRTSAPKMNGGTYEIEFIGRRTTHRGSHGHLGMADHYIVVDRLIALKPIRSPKIVKQAYQPTAG